MAQGTQKVLGGTPYKRYPDPNVKGSANEFGLYPWSAFKAPLCSWNGSEVEVVSGQEEKNIILLLFTSDIPALLELRATDTATNLQFSSGCTNALSAFFLVTSLGGTTPATIPAQGKAISGYTGSGYAGGYPDVYCTGFPAYGFVVRPGAQVSGLATYTEVICVSNASTIAGPVGSLSVDYKQNGAVAPVPILINPYTYTVEIRDAGNIITASDGSLYQVVGLWNPP